MDKSQLANRLLSLAQVEQEAIDSYGQALSKVQDQDIKNNFTLFRSQHSMQLAHLNEAIQALGSAVSQGRPSGSEQRTFPQIGTVSEARQIIETLHHGEQSMLDLYTRAQSELDDLPMDMQAMLFDNYKLDQYHADYLDKILHGSIWDREH